MKLKDIMELNLPVYQRDYPNSLGGTLEIGKVIGEASISTTARAWVRGFEKVPGTESSYRFLFPSQISQHGMSRHRPKRFPVYILGLVNEGEASNLAYATSMLDDTEEINIVRLTNLEEITRITGYRNYPEKD